MTSSEAHLFEQIAESIRIQIARGELEPDDRLPSIREMARLWHCTPGTVSRAYAILSDERLVVSRRGSGTVVKASPLQNEQMPLGPALLTNQMENVLLNMLGQGYSEQEIEAAFSMALARWRSWQGSATAKVEPKSDVLLRFAGSHDLAVEHLAQRFGEHENLELQTVYSGSLGGLIALARGEADIAGSHLWDEATDLYNTPFVERVLPGEDIALVTVAGRTFGLMLPTGNPLQITSLSSLADSSVRWINRQPGSGTRVWLDAQLKKLGIDPDAIDGYENVRTTHNEIAEAVANGKATAGLGIEAAAAAHGLSFAPLANELYQLVIPQAVMETAACQKLLAILQSDSFKETVQAFGGYETVETGSTHWV